MPLPPSRLPPVVGSRGASAMADVPLDTLARPAALPPLPLACRAPVSPVQVGTFVLFQESYHRETFKAMHPTGPKSDFDFRVLTQVGGVWRSRGSQGFGSHPDGADAGETMLYTQWRSAQVRGVSACPWRMLQVGALRAGLWADPFER